MQLFSYTLDQEIAHGYTTQTRFTVANGIECGNFILRCLMHCLCFFIH